MFLGCQLSLFHGVIAWDVTYRIFMCLSCGSHFTPPPEKHMVQLSPFSSSSSRSSTRNATILIDWMNWASSVEVIVMGLPPAPPPPQTSEQIFRPSPPSSSPIPPLPSKQGMGRYSQKPQTQALPRERMRSVSQWRNGGTSSRNLWKRNETMSETWERLLKATWL